MSDSADDKAALDLFGEWLERRSPEEQGRVLVRALDTLSAAGKVLFLERVCDFYRSVTSKLEALTAEVPAGQEAQHARVLGVFRDAVKRSEHAVGLAAKALKFEEDTIDQLARFAPPPSRPK